jgi:hypothetical protein
MSGAEGFFEYNHYLERRHADLKSACKSRAPRGVKTDDELLNRLRETCGEDAIRLEKQAPGM